jgi:hypothetical protein
MTQPRLPDQAGSVWASEANTSRSRFINPHRLFHSVWLPQWLEERPEVSEKAKKLYAYLTSFVGGKGCAWPSFKVLADKLHCSRRHASATSAIEFALPGQSRLFHWCNSSTSGSAGKVKSAGGLGATLALSTSIQPPRRVNNRTRSAQFLPPPNLRRSPAF